MQFVQNARKDLQFSVKLNMTFVQHLEEGYIAVQIEQLMLLQSLTRCEE